MIRRKVLYLFFLVTSLSACNENTKERVNVSPLESFSQLDSLLDQLSESAQIISVPSNQQSVITGKRGTVIFVNPDRLETTDGSSIGSLIEVELLELTDNSELILENVPTVSNGRILVTGGAYFLNMTSSGKQLKIKQGMGIDVEFPLLSDGEMSLFLGEKDSVGQINWIPTQNKFIIKQLPDSNDINYKKKYVKIKKSEFDAIYGFIGSDTLPNQSANEEEVTELEYSEYMKLKAQSEVRKKTYEAIELSNFGWINCDRFLDDPNPKTDINLIVNNDSIKSARFYAVFSDIKSILASNYHQNNINNIVTFDNIPSNREIHLIGLTTINETAYLFKKTINTSVNKEVQVEFFAATHDEILKGLKNIKVNPQLK